MSLLSLIVCVIADTLLPLTPELDSLLAWAAGTALVILGVRLLRWALKDRLSGRARYTLWAVVLVRALLPFQLPFALPLSLSELLPGPAESIQAQTVPAPFSTSEPIEQAQSYYQGLEPGHLGPTIGSMGYVEISQDGKTINYYVDLFSPAEIMRLIWLAGVAVTAGILIVSNGRFHKTLKKSRRPLDIPDCPIPVYVADNLPSPCLVGVLHPAIYLTEETAADETRLRHVLTHELTHYAHKDHIWSALRCMCLTFHWFDPFMWWAAAQSKKDCELSCDEGAVKRLGEGERIPYGRTLVDMVAARNGYDILSCSTTMTGGKKTIQQRVEALVKHPETKAAAAFLAVSLLAVLGLVVFADKTSNLDPNYNLTSPDDGYALLEEILDNELPMYISATQPEADSGYISEPGLVGNAKILLRGDLKPLAKELEPIDYANLDPDFLLTLNLYYSAGEKTNVFYHTFYITMIENTHYIFLREENRDGPIMLTAVGTVSPRTAETMLDCLENQRNFDNKDWQTPQIGYYRYGKLLDDLGGLGIHGKKSGIYSSLNSERYANALEQIIPLLRQVSQVPAGMEDFTFVSGNSIGLHKTLGNISPAPWDGQTYHLAYGNDCYYLCIEHDEESNGPLKYYTPIASMSKETWENILWLAENPDGQLPEPEPKPEPAPPAEPEIHYYVDDPAQVEALIDLFLNDPETIETHGGERLVDWLTNWTYSFTVRYGTYWDFNAVGTEGWYARAIDAGSYYHITIPEHLVDDVLAICESDTPTPIEFASSIKAADISEVFTSYPYSQIDTDHNALAELIRACLDHSIERSYDQWDHGVWQLTVRTTDSSGQSYAGTRDNVLTLCAGQEENVVALYSPYAPDDKTYQLVRSESLYEFVRSCFTPEHTILIHEADPQQAVEAFGAELAEQYRSLGNGHPRAVTDAKFMKAEIFDQSEDAVCVRISLAVAPVEPNTIHWMAGAGIDPIDSGEYAGMWDFTLEYRLQKQPYGTWQCTETATGGLRA